MSEWSMEAFGGGGGGAILLDGAAEAVARAVLAADALGPLDVFKA